MEKQAAEWLGGAAQLEKLTGAITAAKGGAQWPHDRPEAQYMGEFFTKLMVERDLEPWDLQGLWGYTSQQTADRIAGRENPSEKDINRLIKVFDLEETFAQLCNDYGLRAARGARPVMQGSPDVLTHRPAPPARSRKRGPGSPK